MTDLITLCMNGGIMGDNILFSLVIIMIPFCLLFNSILSWKVANEQQELLNSYQKELEKSFEIAQRLDALNPDLIGSFTGTPSERIERQLYALGILND